MRLQSKDIEIAVEIRAQTPKAVLIFDGKNETWIPKLFINDEVEEKGVTTSIFIPEWFAEEKGLI